MKYPTIPVSRVQPLVEMFLQSGVCNTNLSTAWTGQGETMDLRPLATMGRALTSAVESERADPGVDRDRVEGELSAVVHETLGASPISMLDDAGFWRYVALSFCLEFIVWREPRAFSSGDNARWRPYVDGSKPAECVPLRMFLRGRVCEVDGRYDLSSAVPRGADLWRSHILRVRTGSVPSIAQAFVRQQASERMTTEPLRDYARRLNRLWSNIVPVDYTEDEAAELLADVRDRG